MDWTEEKIVEIFKQVEEKSKTDREFRDSLIENSAKAIKTLTGFDIPNELKLNFTEQKLWERTIILPAFEGSELADDQLEQVAGGAKPLGLANPFQKQDTYGAPKSQKNTFSYDGHNPNKANRR